jgi:type II secretory pathway pseudopilin PulG
MTTRTQCSTYRANARATSSRQHVSGFSLIELAVVAVVITLLLGSMLVPLGTQIEKRRNSETEKQLEYIREAMIGFALAKRYLPCPAISAADGREDRDVATDACTDGGGGPKRVGFLPWVTLGVTQNDAWGNLLRYSVDPDFARSDPDFYFTLNSVGDIQIETRDGAGAVVNLSNDEIPASVLSHGKNGFGATSSSGTAQFTPGGWAGDEQVNATGFDEVYVRENSENTAATGGVYDDIVVWLSPNQLFARMVSAGRLP